MGLAEILPADSAALGAVSTWVLPALLGLGLAASTGLRTFLPLLMLALAARFEWFGVALNDQMAWLGSTEALAVLGVATMVEFAGDKIPVVDHGLNLLGYVTRPVAGAVAAGSVFVGVDPMIAAAAGLIIGAPTALAFNAAQTGTRTASTVGTAGTANPILSLIEDVLAFLMVMIAFLLPLLVPLALLAMFFLAWRLFRRARPRREPAAV